MDILAYPMIGFSDSQIIAQIVSTFANGFAKTVTQFTRLLSFSSVFSTSLSLFPPDSMGMSLSFGGFLSHRGFRHTKSPGETATAEDRRRGLPKLVAIRPAPRRNGGGSSAARSRGGATVVLRRLLLVLSERGSVTNKNGIRN